MTSAGPFVDTNDSHMVKKKKKKIMRTTCEMYPYHLTKLRSKRRNWYHSACVFWL